MSKPDAAFTGSVPKIYETYLVPLIFEAYAADLTARLVARKPARVLELAAGTGVVTRSLAGALAASTTIVATDLNQAMLDQAQAIGTSRPVEWKVADALQLPFEDATFDAVVCQFGVMFFPDKPKAFAEARRVLKPGGVLIFNVWDRLKDNEFAELSHNAVAALFPADPPGFLARTPYNYNDAPTIAGHLAAGGFTAKPAFDTVTARSKAGLPLDPAIGYVQGTPLRGEVEARDAAGLSKATDAAAAAIAAKFGNGPVDAKIQAIVVTVEKT
jgi:SAM-dependent methyltransferase